MNSKLILIIAACLFIAACGSGGSSSSPTPSPNSTPTPATATPVPTSGNFVHILVSPGSNNICSNANTPCVTVTICQPGNPANCDSIDNILVDTGSYGLRVFSSLLTNTSGSLEQVTFGGLPVAECVSYADGTSNWGPVQYATVGLNGTFTTESIPIQVLNASFPGMLRYCTGAVITPTAFGINGILGVGPNKTDFGVSYYYACNGNSCSSLQIPSTFVTNPVSKFPDGNKNGLTLVFGSVAQSGVVGADGYGIFGVGSSASNTPGSNGSSFNVFQIESSSPIPINVNSTFQDSVYSSFLDTGSNFLYFANSFLNQCSGGNAGLFCPASLTPEIATMSGSNGIGGTTSATIAFTIGNADSLSVSGNTAFSNVGGAFAGIGGIDWGLPFYLGRTVYMIFAGESAVIGGITYPPSPNGYWIY